MKSEIVLQKLNENKGFTLVEVLASLVIISIILVGSFSLITFTNKAAVSNNERLVAINLATATLERIKVDPFAYFNPPIDSNIINQEFSYNHCETDDCNNLYAITLNDKQYRIMVTINRNSEEKRLGLIGITVKVVLPEANIRHEVEGYVSYGIE